MEAKYWLEHHGLTPSPEGWAAYVEHLHHLGGDVARQKDVGFEDMSRGWAIGTSGWRKALAKEYSHLALNPGLSADEARSLREAAWLKSFKHALSELSKGDEAIAAAAKFAPWKVAVARQVGLAEFGGATDWKLVFPKD